MPSPRVHIDRFLDARAAEVERAELSPEARLALVARHGDFSIAYSTAVQPDFSYFGGTDGYIAFRTKMGRHFALGDPVAGPADRESLIRRFVGMAGDPWFVQIGEETARTLSALGYRVNRLGIDTRLPLPGHDFSGKRNETVRYSERWLAKAGYTLTEDTGGTVAREEVERLSKEWRGARIVKRWEMRFLNRPFSAALMPGMRRFLLLAPQEEQGGRLVALLDFDPLYRDGKVIGYTTSFKRKKNGATPHAEVGLTKFAVDRFRQEGVSVVTLGLSPLAEIGPSGFPESAFWRAAFEKAYASNYVNRRRFNLKGQEAFKRRFHGIEEPTYIAFRKGTLFEMLALLRLIKAF